MWPHKRLTSQQRKHHREELRTDHRPTVRGFGKKMASLLHFGQPKVEGEFTYVCMSSIETASALGSSPPSCFRLPAQVLVLRQRLATNSLQKWGVLHYAVSIGFLFCIKHWPAPESNKVMLCLQENKRFSSKGRAEVSLKTSCTCICKGYWHHSSFNIHSFKLKAPHRKLVEISTLP